MVPATSRPPVTSLQSRWMWRRPIQLPTSINRSVNTVVKRPDRVLCSHRRRPVLGPSPKFLPEPAPPRQRYHYPRRETSKMKLLPFAILLSAAVLFAQTGGDALYQKNCARCHDQGVERAPNRAALKQMAPENIRTALVSGSMSKMNFGLSAAEISAVAEFLTGAAPIAADTQANPAACPTTGASWTDPFAKPYWNGWGAGLTQHRFQPSAMAGLPAPQVPKLKLKWAFAFAGVNRTWAQPTIVGGRIFAGSLSRKVYSLDAKTGCTYWTFDADVPVRTAITIGKLGDGWAAYFGDQHG